MVSGAGRGEPNAPELFGFIGDNTRGGDGRAGCAAVNNWGLNFRKKGVWLPKRYAETELRLEKTGDRTFSRVLTREGEDFAISLRDGQTRVTVMSRVQSLGRDIHL